MTVSSSTPARIRRIGIRRKPNYEQLPRPLAKLREHPLRWSVNFTKKIGVASVVAALGVFAEAGIYYDVTQTTALMDNLWHSLVPNDELRHYIRNVGQGFFGGLLAQQVVWNHYRKLGPLNRLDRWEIARGIPNLKDDKPRSWRQTLATLPLSVLYGTPSFLLAYGLVVYVKRNADDLPLLMAVLQPDDSTAGPTAWARSLSFLTSDWDEKLMGYSAAFFFGRRPAKGEFDDNQTWFAQRHANRNAPFHWWHKAIFWLLPAYHARVNDLRRLGCDAPELHGFWRSSFRWLVPVVVLYCIIRGWYVLNFIAN